MSRDLMPIFALTEDGELKAASAVIRSGEDHYKASSFIASVAEAIEDEVKALTEGKEVGELTVSGSILLESLHRAGLQKTAELLLESPPIMLQASIYCAIGLRAGMNVPEGVVFETVTSDSNLDLRKTADPEDPEINFPPSD